MSFCVDYQAIINKVDPALQYSRDDDFVYLLSFEHGTILFQELPEALVLWSNENKTNSQEFVFMTVYEISPVDVILPFLETQEEYEAAVNLGGELFDFEAEGCEDYSREFGSFILRKVNCNGV